MLDYLLLQSELLFIPLMLITSSLMYEKLLIEREIYKSISLLITYSLLHKLWSYVRDTNFLNKFENSLVPEKLESLRNRTNYQLTKDLVSKFFAMFPFLNFTNSAMLLTGLCYAILSSEIISNYFKAKLSSAFLGYVPTSIQDFCNKYISREDLKKLAKYSFGAASVAKGAQVIKESFDEDNYYERLLLNCNSEREVTDLLQTVKSEYSKKNLLSNKSFYIIFDHNLHTSLLAGCILVGFGIKAYIHSKVYLDTLEAKLIAGNLVKGL